MFDYDTFSKTYSPQPSTMNEARIQYNIDGIEIFIITFFVLFKTKEDFLHNLIRDGYTLDILEVSRKAMLWDERPEVHHQVVEVGWRYESNTHSTQLTPAQRKQLITEFIIDVRDILRQGYNGWEPEEGIVLVAWPHGMKHYFDWSENSAAEGARQRALFAKRVGFGDVKEDDLVWGIYDAKGRVHPL